jgi:hypothetical protein
MGAIAPLLFDFGPSYKDLKYPPDKQGVYISIYYINV